MESGVTQGRLFRPGGFPQGKRELEGRSKFIKKRSNETGTQGGISNWSR